jgi:hypothetical protein
LQRCEPVQRNYPARSGRHQVHAGGAEHVSGFDRNR